MISDTIIDKPVDDTDYNYTHNICNCGRKIVRKHNQVKGVCAICSGDKPKIFDIREIKNPRNTDNDTPYILVEKLNANRDR